MGTGRSAQVIQRLQVLETVLVKQLDRALSKVQNGIVLCWTTVTTIGQVVDTRVLGKVDTWYGGGKARPTWSFVTRAYAGGIDRDLSLDTMNAEIITDVVSNVQLGGVQLYVVVIMLCTGRALDCAVSAMNVQLGHGGMENGLSLWNVARLVVLMLEVLAMLLDTKANLDAGCIEMTSINLDALDVDAFTKGSKGASKDSGEKQDSEFVRMPQDEAGPRHVTVEGS